MNGIYDGLKVFRDPGAFGIGGIIGCVGALKLRLLHPSPLTVEILSVSVAEVLPVSVAEVLSVSVAEVLPISVAEVLPIAGVLPGSAGKIFFFFKLATAAFLFFVSVVKSFLFTE